MCVEGELILDRPMKLLRNFPPLSAKEVIGVTIVLVKDIPEELYEQLVAHPREILDGVDGF